MHDAHVRQTPTGTSHPEPSAGCTVLVVVALLAGCHGEPRRPVFLLDGAAGVALEDVGAVERPALVLGSGRPIRGASGQGVVPLTCELIVPLRIPAAWATATLEATTLMIVDRRVVPQEVLVVRGQAVTLRFGADDAGKPYQFVVTVRPPPTTGTRVRVLGPVRVRGDETFEASVAIPESACANSPDLIVGVDAITSGHGRALQRVRLGPTLGCGRWRRVTFGLGAYGDARVSFRFRMRAVHGADRDRRVDVVVGDPVVWPPPASKPVRPNVILVSLDTLAATHLGTYGYSHPTSPFLDWLASQSTTFEQARAHYPSTAGSHMSLFTGRVPAVHGVRGLTDALPADIETMPERFRAAGWATAAVTEDGTLARSMGFSRGMHTYRENGEGGFRTPGLARATLRAGLHWIRDHAHEPFFLFLHTYEVHTPYVPRLPQLRTVRDEAPRRPLTDRAWLYDGEVRALDQMLAHFWRGLSESGILDHTILVVTADHGEAFGEHGHWAHGTMLYDEVMRVPLLVSGPGIAARRVRETIGLVDVLPTVLELAGLSSPRDVEGRSLVPALRTGHIESRPVAAELQGALGPAADGSTPDERAVWLGTTKVLHDLRTDTWSVFDLGRDPGETHDLVAERTDAIEAARSVLRDYESSARSATPDGSPAPRLGPRDIDRLRQLGYVQ